MAIMLVGYDLHKPGRDYSSLYAALKKFTYCHHLNSIWLLDTANTAEQIRDYLKAHIDSNDTLYVVRLTQYWASYNYECADWLNDPRRSW